MTPFKTYKEVLNYIYSHTNFERKQMPKYNMTTLDLSRITGVMEKIGRPHQKYPVMLIAGTKGKGSTAAMCHSMLVAAGYKTGLYSSPHLHTFRERIRINNDLISEEDVLALVNGLRGYFDEVMGLTAWEIMTTLAFKAFAGKKVDIAVLEVGLGGRLDATNITTPAVSVITPISYDHTHLLGNTLSKIAGEKAGIIKEGGLVVSGYQYPEAMTVIEAVCREKKARLRAVEDEMNCRVGRTSLQGQTIFANGEAYHLALLGRHQAHNACTALMAIDALQNETPLQISAEARAAGLATVRWPGRLEILNQAPLLLLDGAMNGDSARKLRQTLQHYFPGRAVIYVVGVSRDHDYRVILEELLPHSRHVIATQANHPRATPPETLAAVAHTLGYQIDAAGSVEQALQQAVNSANDTGLICVTGSLFCVADARLAWFKQADLPLPAVDPV